MKSEIRKICFEYLNKEITLNQFELEVYSIRANSTFYEELLVFNYSTKYSPVELENLIKSRISLREFEKYKLLLLLNSIANSDENAFLNLLETYELRCQGFWFLEELGMELALKIIGKVDSQITDLSSLQNEIQLFYINSIKLKAIVEANFVLNLLESKMIIPTGNTIGDLRRKCYVDNREDNQISEKELRTIQWIAEGGITNRDTKKYWLQGGPLFELSIVLNNLSNRKSLIEQIIEYFNIPSYQFNIVCDYEELESEKNRYIIGKNDGKVTLHEFVINVDIEINGYRKSRLMISELSDEIVLANIYFFGSRLDAKEWNQIALKSSDENHFEDYFKKLILKSNSILAAMAYENDCTELFDTVEVYPNAQYAPRNIKLEVIEKIVRNRETGFTYCSLKGINKNSNIEIRKKTG